MRCHSNDAVNAIVCRLYELDGMREADPERYMAARIAEIIHDSLNHGRRSFLSKPERERLAALWHICGRPLTEVEEAERRRLEFLEYGRDVSGSESR